MSVLTLVAKPRTPRGPTLLGSTLPPADLLLASHTLPCFTERLPLSAPALPQPPVDAVQAAREPQVLQAAVGTTPPDMAAPQEAASVVGSERVASAGRGGAAEVVGELTTAMGQMLAALQRGMDARFDGLEGQLRGFESRLSRLEEQVAGARGTQGVPGRLFGELT